MKREIMIRYILFIFLMTDLTTLSSSDCYNCLFAVLQDMGHSEDGINGKMGVISE